MPLLLFSIASVSMVIEWLKVQVVPELREKYIQKDDEIWTAALSKFPGYLGKQVWIDAQNADKVVLISHWANREAWKAVPAKELETIEAKFAQQMGKNTYKIVEEGEYQVRKFPQGQV